ncbi:hypothetical protein [Blastococcus sp. TF02A-26]|nr:hypothetical protein [Blastococcus sp. TF02A-26]
MSATSTVERPTTTAERATWTCPNCSGESRVHRKRCAECGTSRY